MPDTHAKPGPLKLPPPQSPEQARIARRLMGHSTSDSWLPAGLWPELDELRAEQLRVRGQVAAELASLDASVARFRDEDEAHKRKLRQAARDGHTGPIEDQRTPVEAREAECSAIRERVWANAAVLADVADSVPVWAREHEDQLLADLRARLVPAQEKRQELEAQLTEARAAEFHVHKLGLWLQDLSDDKAFGRQDHPHPEPPPTQFSQELLARSLERPWYRRPEAEEQVVPWLDQEQEQDDAIEPLSTEDETGVVSGIEEHEGATA